VPDRKNRAAEVNKRLAERYMFHPEIVLMHRGTRVTRTVDHALYPVRAE